MIGLSIRQPVTVVVGVVLVLIAGLLALQRIPIQLTPNVEDTVIAVTTTWEGASPQEVEQEVVDPQEEKLQGVAGLERITSISQQGQGQVRLEFLVGTPKEEALREVSDKLRQVPSYPENVDEPVVEASDPENRDFIAWFVFASSDPSVDVRLLQDFAEDRIKPVLERVDGISEVNVLGGREREVQVRFDPIALAQRGVPVGALVEAIRGTNANRSAGALSESRADVRLRMVSQYRSVEEVEDTLVRETDSGPVRVRDVARVVEAYKESTGFVRSRGMPVIAINAQREVGSNVMEVMQGLRDAVGRLSAPEGLLDAYARRLEMEGELSLSQTYDQTTYIDDALALVRNNIWIGGALAMLVLLLFLRSLRSAGIVALSIPISVVGAVVFLVASGRSVNVISLAGMAFAVGMVVDNAIVVLENVYRHLELGKPPMRAALDGAHEVFGAVVAATLTTVVVFLPILLIEEEAGQLFRDIALAILFAVSLSLFVSLTVIPCAAARLLRPISDAARARRGRGVFGRIPGLIAGLVWRLSGSTAARLGIVALLTALSIIGTRALMPPSDYLPVGNRNLIFGLIVTPPGTSVEQQMEIGERIEATVEPFYEAGRHEPGTQAYRDAVAELPEVPTFDFARMAPGPPIVPPPLENYFVVSFPGSLFHGGIAAEPERAVDLQPLFQHATRAEVLPGSLAFAFQVPLFRLGGRSGSAVEINFSGEELDRVVRAASKVYLDLVGRFGAFAVQPSPSNFDLPTPELQVVPDLRRLGEVGMTPADLGLAVQALGDGALIGDFLDGSQTIDLKLISRAALAEDAIAALGDQPLATPRGSVLPVSGLAELRRVNAPGQIQRDGRQRSVSLQLTPPGSLPLEEAIAAVDGILARGREAGVIPFDVATSFSGSASKLDAVQRAMLGDGTLGGTLSSSMALALLVVYLLMCVLFQSFLRPLIILFSVPLATLGGFAALAAVHRWSLANPYMPVQKLDVLTLLGFVILIGVVVNNAILIVHQSIQFMRGADHGSAASEDREPLAPREAIREAVRSRVRPIFMGTLTSLGGMSPLIFMPGSGSELYRGLGSVVLGGLIVSTVFTLILVPLLLSLVSDLQLRLGLLPEARRGAGDAAGAGVAGSATARRVGGAALLLLALAFLGAGCAGFDRRPAHRERLSALALDVLRSELEDVPESAGAPAAPSSASLDAELLEAVGPRLEQLERLSGPASYAGVEPDLGPDLLGEEPRLAPIRLEDAVAGACVRNLGLELVRMQARVDAEGVVVEDAVFDPVVFSSLELEEAESPSRLPIVNGFPVGAGENVFSRELLQVGAQRLLASGASVSVAGFLERLDNRTDGISFDPDPAWRSGLSLGARQPLLRGYGSTVTTADRALAENRGTRSRLDVRAELLLVVALTEQVYWDLQEAWQRLRIRQRLLERGAEVERVLRERRVFDTAAAEYSDALATLERRRSQLLTEVRLVHAASDNLKALLQDPDLPLSAEELLLPGDALVGGEHPGGLRGSLTRAFRDHPAVHRTLLEIEDAQLRELVAENALQPRLDLAAELDVFGLDDGASGTFESLAEDDDLRLFLGLALELPAGNRGARAEREQARLEGRRALIGLRETLRDVTLEVKGALRDVQTQTARIAANRATRIAEAENLRALQVEEQSRSRLTPEFLALKFQRQERLAAAQLAEVEALANHRRALAAYRHAIGTGLGAGRLIVEELDRR